MKVLDPMGRQLSGRVGDMIYCVRYGRTYARRVAIPGKRRKRAEGEMAEGMVASSNRLRVVQDFFGKLRANVSAEIWRAAGRAVGRLPQNLFYSLNYGCFDGDWRLTRPGELRLTEGALLLPPGLAVEGEGEGWWRVRWGEDREWSTAAPGDRLRVAVVYRLRRLVVRAAGEVTGTRGELEGRFRLPEGLLDGAGVETGEPADGVHAYVYFEREDGGAWSPSWYARLG